MIETGYQSQSTTHCWFFVEGRRKYIPKGASFNVTTISAQNIERLNIRGNVSWPDVEVTLRDSIWSQRVASLSSVYIDITIDLDTHKVIHLILWHDNKPMSSVDHKKYSGSQKSFPWHFYYSFDTATQTLRLHENKDIKTSYPVEVQGSKDSVDFKSDLLAFSVCRHKPDSS